MQTTAVRTNKQPQPSGGELLCEFCGDLPAELACASAANSSCQRRLCSECDTLWHGHPQRRGHARSPLPGRRRRQSPTPPRQPDKWACPRCTFENEIDEAAASCRAPRVCAMCQQSVRVSGDGADAAATSAKRDGVPCPACTLVNPASAVACEACESPLAPLAADSDCFTDDDSEDDEKASAAAKQRQQQQRQSLAERRAADMAEEQRLMAVMNRQQKALEAQRLCQQHLQQPAGASSSSGGRGGMPPKVPRREVHGWGHG